MSIASLPGDLSPLREANFDWAVSLRDVWRDLPYDVPELHARTRSEFQDKLQAMREPGQAGGQASPLGWVLVGAGGSGKTHLLAAMRAEVARQQGVFVLVDMTDVRDFWFTTLNGFLDSLYAADADGLPQYVALLRRLIATVSAEGYLEHNLRVLTHRGDVDSMVRDVDRLLKGLAAAHGGQARLHQDAFRALAYLSALDDATSAAGLSWLQGYSLPPEVLQRLKLQSNREDARHIIRGLSYWMSLLGPTVVAYDQLDPIVHQVAPVAIDLSLEDEAEEQAEQADQERRSLLGGGHARRQAARSVIEQIGGGLAAMRDVCGRSLIVVSCVESTWNFLNEHVLSTYRDRFEEPVRLSPARDTEVLESLIHHRLRPAFLKGRWTPPYPTWPFRQTAIAEMTHETPREVLKLCDAHRRACLAGGEIVELESFAQARRRSLISANAAALAELDELFEHAASAAQPEPFAEEEAEETGLAELLRTVVKCWLIQEEPARPPHCEAILEDEFAASAGPPALHARLRFIDHQNHDRETHVCLRAVQRKHHAAFRKRLQEAAAHAGIDPDLDFRRLYLVRCGEPPTGASVTKALEELQQQGGCLWSLSLEQLRRWIALRDLAERQDPLFELWLQHRRPLDDLPWSVPPCSSAAPPRC